MTAAINAAHDNIRREQHMGIPGSIICEESMPFRVTDEMRFLCSTAVRCNLRLTDG
jgi:hypothetical protein